MNRLDQLRNEIGGGGSVAAEAPEEEQQPETSPAMTIVGVVSVVGLFAWLGFVNPWMLVFAIGILLSVFLHEAGHFITARMTGMKATQFFIGIGPRIWSFHRGETEYGLRAIPVAAYVRIIGMSNMDEVPPADEARTYRQQSYPRRMLVITAGSIMHVIIAIVLLFGVFANRGELREIDGARIAAIEERGAADRAGLEPNDVIVALDGEPIIDDEELGELVRSYSPGDRITVDYRRDGVEQSLDVGAGAQRRPSIGVLRNGDAGRRQRPRGRVPRGVDGEGCAAEHHRARSDDVAVDEGRVHGAQPCQHRVARVRRQRGRDDAADHARRGDAGQRPRRRLAGILRRAVPPRRAERVRRRVQHVPVAAPRRWPCGDRQLRARPISARAALLRRRVEDDAVRDGRDDGVAAALHVRPLPRHHQTPRRMTERRETRQIQVGSVAVGGGAPISVQSMTITKTADVEGTLAQIYALAGAGCDIVRCTCNEAAAAEGLAQIVPRSPVPIIADIHHQYRDGVGGHGGGRSGVAAQPGQHPQAGPDQGGGERGA
ncbi:MAG: flavodoxin-dependent (E)-4-hydroxy-3-methylbut-2-enyl-diphosphate synthase [Ilumatobacteraceae bacterium]